MNETITEDDAIRVIGEHGRGRRLRHDMLEFLTCVWRIAPFVEKIAE